MPSTGSVTSNGICGRYFGVSFKLAVAVLATAMSLLSQPVSRAGTMDAYGTISHMWTDPDYKVTIDQLAASGVKWLRFGVTWGRLLPADPAATTNTFPANSLDGIKWDPAAIAKLDDIIKRCNARGINITFLLNGTPPWASARPDVPTAMNYRPTNWADWEFFVQAMVTRYNGTTIPGCAVKYWEVWNEPDVGGRWLNPVNDLLDATAVNDFVILTQKAAAKIRAVAGNQVVLGGIGVPTTPYGAGSFLDQMLAVSGAAASFDILNYHTYGSATTMIARYNGVKQLVTTYGLGSRKIWITETGFTTNGTVDEIFKANFVDLTYTLHRSLDPNIEKVFWYQYANDFYPCNASESNFGLTSYQQMLPFAALYSFQGAGHNAPPNGVTGAAPAYGEGAVVDFVVQQTYPAQSEFCRPLLYVPATSGDGSYVTNYNGNGSQKLIAASDSGGSHSLYLKVADEWIYQDNGGLDPTVYLDVTYLDNSSFNFAVDYQSQTNVHQAVSVPRTNSGNWKTISLPLPSINFSNGQSYGSDLRIRSGSGDLVVSRIAMRRDYNYGGVVLTSPEHPKLVEHAIVTNPFSEAQNSYTAVGGKPCIQIAGSSKYAYFKVADSLARAGNNNVTLKITFWDEGGDGLKLQYCSTTNTYALATIAKVNTSLTGAWRVATINLTDASFTNAQSFVSDFRVSSMGTSSQYLHSVVVVVSSPTNY